jgi:hypothetical protein
MADSSDSPMIVDRIKLRLSAETFAAIGQARSARPGHVSGKTWLSEAVQESLVREPSHSPELIERRLG